MANKGDILVKVKSEADASGIQDLIDQAGRGFREIDKQLNAALGGEVVKQFVIQTKTDTSGVKQLVLAEKEILTVTDQIISKKTKLQNLERGSVTSLRQQVNEAKQARDQIAKYDQSIGPLGGKVSSLNQRWIEQNLKVQDLQRNLNVASASGFWDRAKAGLNAGGLINFSNGLTQITNGLQSASIIVGQVIGSFNAFIDTLSRLQQFDLTFEAIGASAGETALAFDESSRIALGLGVSLTTVRESFRQLSPVVLAVGGSIQDVSAITEALSSRFVAFGLTGDKARRVMNGIIQAFGKGKLMAEELTQQISEADPAFRTDLAGAIGVSVKELNNLVQEGEITSQVLIDILPKLSKSSLLFGKLGSSATSAAQQLKTANNENGATIEQIQTQFQNLNQLNLEKFAKVFEPFIKSILIVQGAIVDLGTTLISTEGFQALAAVLNNLSIQLAGTFQVIGKIVSVLLNAASSVAAVINAIDNITERFARFRLIAGLLATVITAKLVSALTLLTINGVIGAATAGVKLLAAASVALTTGSLKGLATGLLATAANFLGFNTATRAQIAANLASIGSIKGKTAALINLAAVQKLTATQAAGGNIQLLAEAAGRRAAATAAAQQAAATATAGVASNAAGAAAAGAAGRVAASGAAMGAAGAAASGAAAKVGLFASAGAFLLSPWTLAAVAIAALTYGIIQSGQGAIQGASAYEKFTAVLEGIKSRAKTAAEALDKVSSSTGDFEDRLAGLKVSDIDVSVNIVSEQAILEVAKIRKEVVAAGQEAEKAVRNYNEEIDKSGVEGQRAANLITKAEQTVNAALDATRAKREELLEAATKGGGQISASNKKQLQDYQKNIIALEEQAKIIARTKKEAATKGVPIEFNIEPGKAAIEAIKSRIEALQGNVILELDPAKYAELQDKISGAQARLAFLEGNRIQITADIRFNIQKAELEGARRIAEATKNLLSSSIDLQDSLNGLEQSQIQIKINDRDAELKALQDRKAGEGAIKGVEQEIKTLADEKRRLEIEGIQRKLAALPALQAAERQSLIIAQQIAKLEQERALAAIRLQKLQATVELQNLQKKSAEATDEGTRADLGKQFEIQRQLVALLKEQEDSLVRIGSLTAEVNNKELESLDLKQRQARIDLEAAANNSSRTADLQASANAARDLAGAQSEVAVQTERATTLSQDTAQANRENAQSSAAAADGAREVAEATGEAASEAQAVNQQTANVDSNLGTGATAASRLADELVGGATAASQIASSLLALDGKTISVRVTGIPGLWTGGPTQAGQTYQVNELGQEGFLSAGGSLRAINKPKNALWRAPSSGTVIPAHIWSGLDVPSRGVRTNTKPMTASSGASGLQRVVRAIQSSLGQPRESNQSMHELTAVQARQAIEIGKLSRAVNRLADKDHSVNVSVRNTGSTASIEALNRSL